MTTWADVNAIDPSLHGPNCIRCAHPRVVHFGPCTMEGCDCKVWIAGAEMPVPTTPGERDLWRQMQQVLCDVAKQSADTKAAAGYNSSDPVTRAKYRAEAALLDDVADKLRQIR